MIYDAEHPQENIDEPTWIDIRIASFGAVFGFIVLERALGQALAPALWEHPLIEQARRLAGLEMLYQNDLASYQREAIRHDDNNLILCLERSQGLSTSEAIAETRHRLVRTRDEFAEIRVRTAHIPWTPEQRQLVTQYIHGLESMVTGLQWWEKATGRYSGPETASDTAYGFEELLY